jgi:CheY-like chemotaxis protein
MGRSVLVVDDDASFRELAGGVLRSWGHRVVGEAATVAEALARTAELHPDAVLADVGLPDGDGLQLARSLRALPGAPRVVLISSDAGATDGTEAHDVGAVGFVPKCDLPSHRLRRMIEG